MLPPVYSITEAPGRRRPSFSAASTIASAILSFMLPVGFSYSSLIRTLALPSGTILCNGISLVRPIMARTVMDSPSLGQACSWVSSGNPQHTRLVIHRPDKA